MEKTSKVTKMVGFVDDDKNSELHYAAALGDETEVVELIEEMGHEIDSVNYLGWTPLLMATRNGHIKIVEILLDYRADSTRENAFGFNILLLAIASGELEITMVVLKHLLCGGISKKSLETIFSPISLTILFRNNDILDYLIQEEFCANIKSQIGGLSPVDIATAMNNNVALEKLIGKTDKYDTEQKGETFLNDNEQAWTQNLIAAPQQQFGIPSPVFFVQPATSPFYSQPTTPMYTLVPNNPIVGNSDLCSPYSHQPPPPPNLSPFISSMYYNIPQVFFPSNFPVNQFIPPQNPTIFYEAEIDRNTIEM